MTRVRPAVIKVFEKSYGRGAGGDTTLSYSFSVDIPAVTTGYYDLPVVATNYENVYQCITISCYDDTAIHQVVFMVVANAWVFFWVDFLTGGIFDFPGQPIGAGSTVRVLITNNSAGTLTFIGAINWVSSRIV